MMIKCICGCGKEFEQNHGQHFYATVECWQKHNTHADGFFGEQVTSKAPGTCFYCNRPARPGLQTCKRHEGGLMR